MAPCWWPEKTSLDTIPSQRRRQAVKSMPAVNKMVDEVGMPEFVGEAPGIKAREAQDYLTKMTRGILAVRPLIDALDHPVSVFLPGGGSQGGQPHGKEQRA